MSKKPDVSPLDGATRKRQYEERKRETHRRLELRVLNSDIERIEKIGVKLNRLIPTLLRYHDDYKKLVDSMNLASQDAYLPDCRHRAWRRLGDDLLGFVGCERPVDLAFQHHLRERVEDALLEMLSDMLDGQRPRALPLDLLSAMLTNDPALKTGSPAE